MYREGAEVSEIMVNYKYVTLKKEIKPLKKIGLLLLIVLIITNMLSASVFSSEASEQMQAVWIATVYNIDFPSVKNDPEAQKKEYLQRLDQLEAVGINAVFVQVRPKADALYSSAINPWSDILTGTQGADPGYDPLGFMVEEAHKRGMQFHAWLNPYRVTTSGTDLNALAWNHPARNHPDWVLYHNGALYYNPEKEGVKNHIVETIQEIVLNYDVDGIVFDDYFYPSNYPLPQGEGRDGLVANERRSHVNAMVERVHGVIKATKANVLFGISPSGIWKNQSSDPTGSNTAGNESYYSVYADTRTWIQNGWIDYVSPQIYWEIGHKVANYETLVKWWSNEVKDTNVHLYISQCLYKESVAGQITSQLQMSQMYPEIGGSIYYNMKNLLADTGGCKTKIKAYNNENAYVAQEVSSQLPASANETNAFSDVLTGTVTANRLNVRSGAGQQHGILCCVTNGTTVKILNENAGWYEVEFSDGLTGWVSRDYIKMK